MRCFFEVRGAIDMAVGPEYPLDKLSSNFRIPTRPRPGLSLLLTEVSVLKFRSVEADREEGAFFKTSSGL